MARVFEILSSSECLVSRMYLAELAEDAGDVLLGGLLGRQGAGHGARPGRGLLAQVARVLPAAEGGGGGEGEGWEGWMEWGEGTDVARPLSKRCYYILNIFFYQKIVVGGDV